MFISDRKLRLAPTFCLALLLLSACVIAPAPAAAPADLVIAVPAGALSLALESVAKDYAQQSGGRVCVEALSSNEYYRTVSAVLLAGLDTYDVVYVSAEDLAAWAGYHAIQPFPDDLDTAPLAPWLPVVTISGRLYGMPTQPDPVGLWYRADLMDSLGLSLPFDWEMIRRAAQAQLPPPIQYGMITAGSDAGIDFIAVLASYGGAVVSSQYQVEMDSAAALDALQTYQAISPTGAEDFTRANVLDALAEGHAAMGIGPYSAGARLLDCAASPKVCRTGRSLLAWARLPGIPEDQAVGSLGAWAIPQNAARAEQARRFLGWLGGEAGARAWSKVGGIPAHRGVLAALNGEHPLRQVDAYRTAFPPLATADLLWKASNGAVQAAVSTERSPQEALVAAADKVRRALRQAEVVQEE